MIKILLFIVLTFFQFFLVPKAIFASSCTVIGTQLNPDHTLRVYASSLLPNTSYTVALSGTFVDKTVTVNDRPVAGSSSNSDSSGGWDNNVPILSINVSDGKTYAVSLISSNGDKCDVGSFTYSTTVAPPTAATCEITSVKGQGTSPADTRIGEPILISANKLEGNSTYSVILDELDTGQRIRVPSAVSTYTATVTIPNRIQTDPGEFTYISPGAHTLKLHHITNTADRCTSSINLKAQKLSSCTVSHTTSPSDDPTGFYVNVQGTSLYPNVNHEIRFDGKRIDYNGGFVKSDSNGIVNYTFKVTSSGSVVVSLVPAEGTTAGYYECIANPNPFTITISPPAVPLPVEPRPAEPTCSDNGCIKGGGIPCSGGNGIMTAIGCIRTNPADFVTDLIRFVIGISGGFSFLLMLMGAFQMITSNGNPDSLQNGRSRLTSAIIGLLFVIFATLLMQIIGVDILFKGFAGFSK